MLKLSKLILVGFLLSPACFSVFAQSNPLPDPWHKVNEALEKNLPKTAIEALEAMIKDATIQNNYGQVVKAIAHKIALESQLEGNKPEEKIIRMQMQLAKVPKELVPMLNTILANWYWQYFQQNKWRIMERTTTSRAPSEDFRTWDLKRLFAEIDKTYQSALLAAPTLKAMPIGDFEDLFEKSVKPELPDTYRPTAYDFIVIKALEFYSSGEHGATQAEDAFEVLATDAIFAPVDEFLQWKPNSSEVESPQLRAISLYQDLLNFHKKDTDPSAFRDADLARLRYGYNIVVGDDKLETYKKSLLHAIDAFRGHELVSMARFQLAKVLKDEGELLESHTWAEKGASEFPQSVGGRSCKNLLSELEEPELHISTEHVWNAPYPKIKVFHKNIGKIHFRAVAGNWETRLQQNHGGSGENTLEQQNQILARSPVYSWTVVISPSTDYKLKIDFFNAPKTLAPGYYTIIASANQDFGVVKNSLSFAEVWVSDLALVLRTRTNGFIEGLLTSALSGVAIEGAEINAWRFDQQGKSIALPDTQTDADGCFSYNYPQGSLLIRARFKQQEIADTDNIRAHNNNSPNQEFRSVLVTDRAIYRPGQSIQFKGICVEVDTDKDNYRILPKEKVVVVLKDPNGKDVAQLELVSNDYGSFTGSFMAPRDRLLGTMSLHVISRAEGHASIRVEEYKRPKFELTLALPNNQFKLGGTVTVHGKAIAYTGAAIDGAKVKYRVSRSVRWPDWSKFCGLRYLLHGRFLDLEIAHGTTITGKDLEIAHGTTITGKDGAFKIAFVAKPELKIPEKYEPIFDYTVSVDVTDSAGETRSLEKMFSIGTTAMQATITAKDWQTVDQLVELHINTTTVNGEALEAHGEFKVYRLKEPEQVIRPQILDVDRYRYYSPIHLPEEPRDLSNPNNWDLGEIVATKEFQTQPNGLTSQKIQLNAGLYRVVLQTKDAYGKNITAIHPLEVIDPQATKCALKIPHKVSAEKWSAEVGTEFSMLWATGYESGSALIEVEHRGKLLKRYWTNREHTQVPIKIAVNEKMRGGFSVHVTQIAENRVYVSSHEIDVPWNRNLLVTWEHFTSKLRPGQSETWTAVVKGNNAMAAVAEMVATLYDSSLDTYAPLNWPDLQLFRRERSRFWSELVNSIRQFQPYQNTKQVLPMTIGPLHRSFSKHLACIDVVNDEGANRTIVTSFCENSKCEKISLEAPSPAMSSDDETMPSESSPTASALTSPKPLALTPTRKNLNETAFFFPNLMSDKDGSVRISFTMPEALTKWKFMGFAHDTNLNSGFITGEAITSKDLMVQPNPPRFLREGDTFEFSVKVSNLSATQQQGQLKLSLSDLETGRVLDQELSLLVSEQKFEVPAQESRSYFWTLVVPEGAKFLSYKVVGSTGQLSDGEEGLLPVLSRRILVTESLSLPIKNAGQKKFSFDKLLKSDSSGSLKHQSLTLQMASNPSWYAIMALPYLMEYPHECSEQTFNRLYANLLANKIANSQPNIRKTFDQWKNTAALDSPLLQHRDLKALMIEETPWLREANSESQARKNLGLLFDANRLNSEIERCTNQLRDLQLQDGSWSWFPGGYRNDYITLYITAGFGRLKHLGIAIDSTMAHKSIDRLDRWISESYGEICRRDQKNANNLSSTIALYIYGRSFFLNDKPVEIQNQEAFDYFVAQAQQYGVKWSDRQSQAHLALALKRLGDAKTPVAIMNSIKEHAVRQEELGMFWRDSENLWGWHRAPIETQALMIEAFDEVMNDSVAVEDCKVWLLKQKQTQHWKTTKATADAVYALMLHGTEHLASETMVEVSLAGNLIQADKLEAGTGFTSKRFNSTEITPQMGEISVTKKDRGVAWGSVHWQYFEDVSKITSHEATPLKLKKSAFIKVDTKNGKELRPVSGNIHVGDELVIRLELRVDRDMDYVHLKDQRGSGVEPRNMLSQYKFQDGLAYYESPKDTASHFFIDYLPKGVFVFEYSAMIQHRGKYPTGIAEIQCMYAPEFNSHSESLGLNVD